MSAAERIAEIARRADLILENEATLRTRAFDLGSLLLDLRDLLEQSTDVELRQAADVIGEAAEDALNVFEAECRAAERRKGSGNVLPFLAENAP